MIDKGSRVKSIHVLLGGIGESYDRSSGEAFDSAGQSVTDPQILEDYRDDRLLINLHAYAKATYPNLPILGIVRAYEVAQDNKCYKRRLIDRNPGERGRHSNVLEQHATPGKTRNRCDFDLIIADLFPRALEYEAHLANGIALAEESGNPFGRLRSNFDQGSPGRVQPGFEGRVGRKFTDPSWPRFVQSCFYNFRKFAYRIIYTIRTGEEDVPKSPCRISEGVNTKRKLDRWQTTRPWFHHQFLRGACHRC